MVGTIPNDGRGPPPEPLSVSEVTSQVKETLEARFADVWVAGEVSNLTRASSGHIYLSLKDESALLKAVVWRGTVPQLAIEPSEGLEVVCHGRLEVYAPRGTYQLTIDRLHAIGTGALEAKLRRLHAQLEAEGLFSAARKRPLPSFPARVAVVTSPTGAAIADFIETVADDRWGTIPGTGALRLEAVQSVVDKFPDLIAQQPDNPDLKYDAALIYRRCANLSRVLGRLDEAKQL